MYLINGTSARISPAGLLSVAALLAAIFVFASHAAPGTVEAQSPPPSECESTSQNGFELDAEFQAGSEPGGPGAVLLSWNCNPTEMRGVQVSVLDGSEDESSRIRGFTNHWDTNHSGPIPNSVLDLLPQGSGPDQCYAVELLDMGGSTEAAMRGDSMTDAVIAKSEVACTMEVTFSQATYTVTEGSSITIAVYASPDARRSMSIPVSVTSSNAETGDYSVGGLSDDALDFETGNSSKTLTINAVNDSDRDNETLTLSFGRLPAGVGPGTQATAQVTINDTTPAPVQRSVTQLSVSFGRASYSVDEGSDATITVNVSPAANRSLRIPVSATSSNAESGDYSVSGTPLTFANGESSKTFTISTVSDDDRENETVSLSFGNLPNGVSAGNQSTSQLMIEDTTVLELETSFAQATYTVSEGSDATITVNVSPAANRSLRIPVSATSFNAESGDYSVSGTPLTFANGESSKTFTISTVSDDDRENETVSLSFGNHPNGVSAGNQSTSQLTITDTTPASRESRGSGGGGSGGRWRGFATQPANRPPVFVEGSNAKRTVAENSTHSTVLGASVSATDPDGDVLIYTMDGPDARSFTLDSRTGQLRTAVDLDYETKATYFLIMYVYDQRGGRDSVVVAVRVTDVAEQAVVAEQPVVIEVSGPIPAHVPVATPTPIPAATATPQPTDLPAPQPTEPPTPLPAPEPAASLGTLWSPWPAIPSMQTPSPTGTQQPTLTVIPTATPELVGDSQSGTFLEFGVGVPLGDFNSTNFESSAVPLPEEDGHLLIWPILLEVLGATMMVVGVGMFVFSTPNKVEIGNRDFIMNSRHDK